MKILIIGAGEVGTCLTQQLSNEHDITLMDQNPDNVQYAADNLDARIVCGNGASFKDLETAGIRDAQVVAAMTQHDELNLIICKIARRAGVGMTIARVRSEEYMSPDFILTKQDLGVDHFIHPEYETAQTILRLLRQSVATDMVPLGGGQIELIGIRLDKESPVAYKQLSNLPDFAHGKLMRICAIKRGEHTIIPGGNDMLMPRDQVFIICEPSSLSSIITMTGKTDRKIENVMILGGGMTGRFVGEGLPAGTNFKIIEIDPDKSQKLADRLKKGLVIQGDGTDIDLLALEGLTDMDALVSVTASDETNIMSSLVARHLEVPRAIALVSNLNYLPFAPSIGMDVVVSKQVVTANATRSLIRSEHESSKAIIPGLDAQIQEFILTSKSRLIGRLLSKAKLPENIGIGAVIRNNEVLIPSGDTRLEVDDKVYVFSLPNSINQVAKLFS